MALFYGRKKITPIINKGNTIRNQNKTVMIKPSDCTGDIITIQHDEGYTGLGDVRVLTAKEEIAINGELTNKVISADNDYIYINGQVVSHKSYGDVTANARLTFEPISHEVQVTASDLENTDNKVTFAIPYDKDKICTEIVVDLSVIKQLLEDI